MVAVSGYNRAWVTKMIEDIRCDLYEPAVIREMTYSGCIKMKNSGRPFVRIAKYIYGMDRFDSK